MKITKDIIQDMLPLYSSGECSPDTKHLVEEYLNANPEFARHAKDSMRTPPLENIPGQLGKEDELRSLAKTRRLLRTRSYIVGLDRKSTRLNSSHSDRSRMPSSA